MHKVDTAMVVNDYPKNTATDFGIFKKHIFLNTSANTDLAEQYLRAAERYYEGTTNSQLLTASYTYQLSNWPCHSNKIHLPLPPLQEVESITYIDVDDQEQTLDPSTYTVDTASRPGRVLLSSKPSLSRKDWLFPKVSITFTCGTDDGNQVPADAKQAILLLAADWYAQRSDTVLGKAPTTIPNNFQNLAMKYRTVNPEGYYFNWKYEGFYYPIDGFYVGGMYGF